MSFHCNAATALTITWRTQCQALSHVSSTCRRELGNCKAFVSNTCLATLGCCAGSLTIACAASSLQLVLNFKSNSAVEGHVVKQEGSRRTATAHMAGRWSEQIHVKAAAQHANGPDLEGESALEPCPVPSASGSLQVPCCMAGRLCDSACQLERAVHKAAMCCRLAVQLQQLWRRQQQSGGPPSARTHAADRPVELHLGCCTCQQ